MRGLQFTMSRANLLRFIGVSSTPSLLTWRTYKGIVRPTPLVVAGEKHR